MQTFMDFVSLFWSVMYIAFRWFLDGMGFILKTIAFLIYDGLLTAVVAVFNTLDIGTFATNLVGLWAGLPPSLLYVVHAVGLPPALTLVSSAVLTRKALDLIPAEFTRF